MSCIGAAAPTSTSVTASNIGSSVWGTGPFTTDSSLSKIARYLGATNGSTVNLNITDIGCQASFAGGTANGVTTITYGAYRGMTVTLGVATPIHGSCNNTVQYSCTTGTSINQNAGSCGGTSTWTCSGANGGSNASCTKANAACTVNSCTLPATLDCVLGS